MDGAADDLDAAIAVLAATPLAAQIYDREGRLRWVSDELLALAGAEADEEVGVGLLPAEADGDVDGRAWRGVLGDAAFDALMAELSARLDPSAEHPSLWVREAPLALQGRRLSVGMMGISLRGADGALAGTATVYAPTLPARVLALLSEGDEAMFARAAALTVPAQRAAAVLFADIDSSGPLSRRLPTATYFELVRGITSAFDDLVAEHGGIVGKHAGDGASAFFLAEHAGGDAAAAEAALRTALALPGAVRGHVEAMAAEGRGIGDAGACRMNVGLHWGANLYLGQVVTGGRLEVTALGDEVNECARIEQTAADGQVLVSKTLVERLADGALARLGVAPDTVLYRTLGELAPGSKAARDAATLAVVDVGGAHVSAAGGYDDPQRSHEAPPHSP